jgi:hypothetical protein
MADKSLSIQLKVSADGLVEGLKIAGQSVEGASQAFRTHFGKAGESASGLTAVLREFKGEATQAGRVASFYARDLAEIIPGATGASGAIKQVFGALLSGSAAGAAIELVIAGLAQVNEHLQEEEKLQRAVRNAGIDAAFSINSEIRKLNDSLDGTLTKTAALKRNLGDGIRSAAKEAMKASADAITGDESFWGKIKGTAKGIASQLFPNVLGDLGPEASKKIGDAYVVVNKVIEEQEKHATDIAKAEGREQAKGFYDAANETVEIESKTKDRIFQLRAQLKIETDKLATDAILGDQKNADLRLARVKALKAAERLEERKVIEQEEGFKVKSEADADKQVFDYFQEKQKEKLRVYMETQQKIEENAKKTARDIVQPLESAFSSAFRGIIDGTKDFATSMKDLVAGLFNAVLDGGLKMAAQWLEAKIAARIADKALNLSATQGNIATAAAGAAASQAFIPFVGPDLGVAAAGAMTGFLESLTMPLLSASGGFDVPGGINPITQLHAREMVLPAQYADVIRGLDGGAGGDMHVHLHAWDGQSVDDWLKSGKGDQALVNWNRRMRRRGRI